MRHTMQSLSKLRKRFAPSPIAADIAHLSEGDRQALELLIQAARLMDEIYLRQTWSKSPGIKAELARQSSPLARARLRYLRINGGPWSELDDHEPFLEGVPSRPDGANFYPEDMTKEEFDTWLNGLGEEERKQATGFFHVIRRDQSGRLKAVPYSEEYRDLLEPAADLLRRAAALTDNQSLSRFLSLRAEAFHTNDYYDSDVAWMELDSPIDVVIGPYEVYMDRMFNYKAAFECFVTIRDTEHSARLVQFAGRLQEIEDNLPIDAVYRNPRIAGMSPIVVANEVIGGGEANSGVRTAAFNLPNDERIVAEKGTKQVMLKNIQRAKFAHVLTPIAQCLMSEEMLKHLSFTAFFDHIVFHELLHGIGPHNIKVAELMTTVRMRLKELHSAFEEAKADICSLFALQLLIDRGVYSSSTELSLYATYVASSFRSVRFGITEAHGRGQALQFNYLFERGAITLDRHSGRFSLDVGKMKEGVRSLAHEIMTAQAQGSYERAKELLDRYGVMSPELTEALGRITHVPIDIEAIHLPSGANRKS